MSKFYTIFETANLESSDARNSPEFHNILDKRVSSFGGNVITISVFFFLTVSNI